MPPIRATWQDLTDPDTIFQGISPYLNNSTTAMKKYRLATTGLILLMLMTACDSKLVYDRSQQLNGAAWHRDSVLQFEVNIDDSLTFHNFYISIRNNTDYPYSNIFFFLETEFPNGHITRDTLECILAARDGKWLGSGSGRLRDNMILLRGAMRFPLIGTYRFCLEQAMRDTLLSGIEDVGIRIEEAG
jgi:gliding motility-associated lipoprotein GldH